MQVQGQGLVSWSSTTGQGLKFPRRHQRCLLLHVAEAEEGSEDTLISTVSVDRKPQAAADATERFISTKETAKSRWPLAYVTYRDLSLIHI